MQPYAHLYHASASGQEAGLIPVSADSLPTLTTAPPREFDGPGDQWSPETLLCAAAADCFILTFRAVARASSVQWQTLDCRIEGTLERTEQGLKFTRFETNVQLYVASTVDAEKCQRLRDKAGHGFDEGVAATIDHPAHNGSMLVSCAARPPQGA